MRCFIYKKEPSRRAKAPPRTWHIDIDLFSDRYTLNGNKNPTTIEIDNLPEEFLEYPGHEKNKYNREDEINDIKNTILNNLKFTDYDLDRMINSYDHIIPIIGNVFGDLSNLSLYNIDPSKSKLDNDISQGPGIRKDGFGLASTLSAIQSGNEFYIGEEFRYGRYIPSELSKEIDKRILDYAQFVNNSISRIEVREDFQNSLYQANIVFNSDEVKSGSIKLPFSAISDGTAKWIALTIAVLTNFNVLAIEEPENFLHPRMQEIFVDLLRTSLGDNHLSRMILVSTHSETLLNFCNPREVIIAEFLNGSTRASRPANADAVSEEIRRTGFGLGYYYANDSLD